MKNLIERLIFSFIFIIENQLSVILGGGGQTSKVMTSLEMLDFFPYFLSWKAAEPGYLLRIFEHWTKHM